MKKELKYMIIEYTSSDKKYIDEFVSYLEQVSQEIVEYFNIDFLDNRIKIRLWNSLEDFRNLYLKYGYSLTKDGNVPNWVCGFVYNSDVEALTLDEYKKTHGHEKDNLKDLMHLILHEFVHACENTMSNNGHYAWLSEGLATTISHQYRGANLIFNATLVEMINGCQDFSNYYTMFTYVSNTYGHNYIMKLLKNFDLLKIDTPRLYEETINYVEKEKQNNNGN